MGINATFIINPASGFGKTKTKQRALIKAIHAENKSAKIVFTRHVLHAISLARQELTQGAERLVVVGGDGTLNEVVNGYFDRDGEPLNHRASIAIVPSGSGSDFIRSTEHKNTLSESIHWALNGPAKVTDVGLVEALDALGVPVSRFFINVSSVGLSGLVAGFMKTVTRRFGAKSAYFISTWQAIRAFNAPTISLKFGDREKIIKNCSLVSFANGKYFGSGMKIAPDAEIDDGILDVVTIQDLSAMFFLLNGHHIYRGTHRDLSNVSYSREAACRVETLNKEPIYVETDGELFAQLPAQYSVHKHPILMVR